MLKPRVIILLIAILLIPANLVCGYDDGFGPAKSLESKNFTVYYSSQLNSGALARQLNITAGDRILAGVGPLPRGGAAQPDLADGLDTLFYAVCSILDMNLYTFRGTIKICRNHDQLSRIYTDMFNVSLRGQHSFYVADSNTIYISQERFKREILGHEMAHAVISRYFVVPPPVKISEILAGYVEYQLRK